MAITGPIVTMFAGNALVLRFTVRDKDQAPDAVTGIYPVKNLTGFTWKWALSRKIGNSFVADVPLVEKSGSPASPHSAGVIEVALALVDTDDLAGLYYQQLEIYETGAGNASTVVFEGDFRIKVNVVNA